MKRVLIAVIIILMVAPMAFAKDVKFEASLDRDEIALGETAQMGLSFYGTQAVPAPDINNIDGLDIRYLGPSTMMTVINGKVSSSITHMYSVTPLKLGKFQLGPFSFTFNRDNYSSNMVFLQVVETTRKPVVRKATQRKAAEEPAPPVEETVSSDRIFLTLTAAKTKVYVNELVPIMVKLYVNRMDVSDIQLPTFGQEGFSKAEFKEPKQYREEYGGLIYDVLEFKTSVFGTRPGDYKLGPAKIKANIVVKKKMRRSSVMDDPFDEDSFYDNFLTRYEKRPVELQSDDIPFTVMPLPAEGRPQDFSGAVGDYQFIFSVSPKKLKVGDPLTLKMEINGVGNPNTVLVPKLENAEGFKAYEPEVKTEENHKTFRQVLIPETDEVTETPKATFNYFDPSKGEYRTITQGPLPIQVEKTKDQAPAQVIGPAPVSAIPEMLAEKEEPRRDIIYIKESPGELSRKGQRIYASKTFAAVMILPFVFLVSFYVMMGRERRIKSDLRYAGRVAASRASRYGVKKLRDCIKSADQKEFYEALSDILQQYLGGKLRIYAAGMTYDAVESVLAPKEVDPDILIKIKRLFEAADQSRFALSKADELKMRSDLSDLEDIIRYLERVRL
jgi:hypothetical protein